MLCVKRVLVICIGVVFCLMWGISPVYAEEVTKDEPIDEDVIYVTPAVEIPGLGQKEIFEQPKPVVRINKGVRTEVKLIDECLDERMHIVDVARNGGITLDSYNDCARWVYKVLQEAGFENAPYWSGARYWEHFSDPSHTMENMPVGAIAIGTGHNSDTQGTGYYYGHVGICVGDTDGDGEVEVRDCIGPGNSNVRTQPLSVWVSWQTDRYSGYVSHEPGFVGWLYYPDLERAGVEFNWP